MSLLVRRGTVLRMSPLYVGFHVPLELRAEGTEGAFERLVSQMAPDVPLQVVPPAAGPPTDRAVKLPTTAKLKIPIISLYLSAPTGIRYTTGTAFSVTISEH